MLDRRQVTDPGRHRHGLGLGVLGLRGVAIGPGILVEDGVGPLLADLAVGRHAEPSEGARRGVGGVTGGILGAEPLLDGLLRAPGVDATHIGDDDLVTGHPHLTGEVVGGQQTDVLHRFLRLLLVPGEGGQRVGAPQTDEDVAVLGGGDAGRLVAHLGARVGLGGDRLDDLVGAGVDHRDGVGAGVGHQQGVADRVHGGGVQSHPDATDLGIGLGDVDGRQGAVGGGAQVRVGRHVGAVGVHRVVGAIGLASTLVAHVELVADQLHCARGDTDLPGVGHLLGTEVDRGDAVLPVDRDVEGLAVGGEGWFAGQRFLLTLVREGDEVGTGGLAPLA